jgi:heat shock protein HslJ
MGGEAPGNRRLGRCVERPANLAGSTEPEVHTMRSLPLVLLTVGALLAPATALAGGGATTPPSRFFVITGLALGDKRIEASGKISIDGGQLIASVGCNMIGGKVTLDGDTLTIPEPLAMTEMACLGVNGDTEAMLIKILQAGPFTIGNGAWTANDAAIFVEELPAGPGPGASISPPDDGVVSSSPEPGGGRPAVSCPPIPLATNGTFPVDVPPDAGSGGGTGGSAGGSTGSSDGSTGSGSAPAATAVDLPLATAGDGPAATAVAEPGATPANEPGSTTEPPPPPEPAATPDLGQTEPDPTVSEPGIGTDPGIGKPVMSDPCLGWMMADGRADTGGAGVEPPKAADAAAEHASGAADASALVPMSIALGVVLLIGFLGVRRLRSTRPPTEAGGRTTSAS